MSRAEYSSWSKLIKDLKKVEIYFIEEDDERSQRQRPWHLRKRNDVEELKRSRTAYAKELSRSTRENREYKAENTELKRALEASKAENARLEAEVNVRKRAERRAKKRVRFVEKQKANIEEKFTAKDLEFSKKLRRLSKKYGAEFDLSCLGIEQIDNEIQSKVTSKIL